MSLDRWVTHSPGETSAVGFSIARQLTRGDVVALIGDLGAGKTQCVRGIAEAFQCQPHVSSPTFVIMNRYDGVDAEGQELLLYHVDLYRLEEKDAILDLGLEEVMDSGGITVIEWAERMEWLLPARTWKVRCTLGPFENDRVLELTIPDHDVRSGDRSVFKSHRGAGQ